MITRTYPFLIKKREGQFYGSFPNFPQLEISPQVDLQQLTQNAFSIGQYYVNSKAVTELPESSSLLEIVKTSEWKEKYCTAFQFSYSHKCAKLGNVRVVQELSEDLILTGWTIVLDEEFKAKIEKLPYFYFLVLKEDKLRLPIQVPQRLCEEFCQTLQEKDYNVYKAIELLQKMEQLIGEEK